VAALAIEIADVALAAVREDALVATSAGVALLDPAGVIVGDAALAAMRLRPVLANDRFWMDPGPEPLQRAVPGAATHSDLAYLHLRQFYAACGGDADTLLFAVPSHWRERELGLLWGMAGAAGLPVEGCVDAAVAACAALPAHRTLLHLDVQQHQSVLTEMAGSDLLRRRRVEVAARVGLRTLQGCWAQFVAEAMVRRTRFDPQHHSSSEQALLDRLPGWLETARHAGEVLAELEFGGRRFGVELRRDEFAFAAEAWYTQLADLVQSARRAGEPATLVLSARAAALPGLAERFRRERELELLSLRQGAAAFGALAHRTAVRGDGSPALVTALERAIPPAQAAARGRVGARPTHLVHAGVAHALGPEPLQLGTAPAAGRGVVLPAELPGVSRQHCIVVATRGDVVVRDQSRHGTFLNGERVAGEAALRAGDRLRLGTPGVVLDLVAVA
jgi:FHA domain